MATLTPIISVLVISVIIIQFLLNWLMPQFRFLFLFNVVLFFQGLSISLLRNTVPESLGILLVLTSGYHISNSIRENNNLFQSDNNILSYVSNLRKNSSIYNLFPYVGFVIILVVFGRNLFLEDSFGQKDRLLIISAITWISYNYTPPGFERERDFIFLFSNLLIATLIFPAIIYNLIARGDPNLRSRLIYIFLVVPLENLLNFTGYEAWDRGGSFTSSGGHKWGVLSYKTTDGRIESVLIAEMCSGLYSIYIFTSAFAAYVLTEYKKWDAKVNLLLLVGVLTAYLANLLRMYLIILVGVYWGGAKLYWAHTNLGWLIFMFWVGLFWILLLPSLFSESD